MSDAMHDTSVPPTTTSPVERLRASRARLSRALQVAQGGRPRDRSEEARDTSPFNLADLAERAVRAAWSHHPLRSAWRVLRQIVGPATADQLRPLVTAHPLRTVTIAAGLGAALVWLRPWRLLPQAALLSMLLPQRAIWQALKTSGLDRLADGAWLAQWVEDALSPAASQPEGESAEASPGNAADTATTASTTAPAAPTEPPTTAEHEVLQRVQPGADGARAA